MIQDDIFSMQYHYQNKDLEIVKDEYYPWDTYKDGYEDKVILYYHPFQFLPLRRLMMGLEFSLGGNYFENERNIDESFMKMKNRILKNVELSKKSYEENWIPRIGLLILLDEAYGPLAKQSFKVNIEKESSVYRNEWMEWREKLFKPEPLLEVCKLTSNDVKKFYENVATEGEFLPTF